MTVAIKIENGLRRGSFDIAGIRGTVPAQAITSTNLRHAEDAGFDPALFKARVAVINEFDPKKLVRDPVYERRRIRAISKTIRRYPEYLFLLALQGVKTNVPRKKSGKIIHPFQFTRNNNDFLIAFQQKCGFQLIRVFFNYEHNVHEDYRHYRNLVPNGRFVASLDENMPFKHFKWLYLESLRRSDEVITFFGHNPSRNRRNPDNMRNLTFLSERESDNILRLTTSTEKHIKKTVSSIIHHYFGIDVCSFSTSRWRDQPAKNHTMVVLDHFRYVALLPTTARRCVITGKNLYRSAKEFGLSLGRPSIPVSTHDIAHLNEQFSTLHKTHTRKSLGSIVDESL